MVMLKVVEPVNGIKKLINLVQKVAHIAYLQIISIN